MSKATLTTTTFGIQNAPSWYKHVELSSNEITQRDNIIKAFTDAIKNLQAEKYPANKDIFGEIGPQITKMVKAAFPEMYLDDNITKLIEKGKDEGKKTELEAFREGIEDDVKKIDAFMINVRKASEIMSDIQVYKDILKSKPHYTKENLDKLKKLEGGLSMLNLSFNSDNLWVVDPKSVKYVFGIDKIFSLDLTSIFKKRVGVTNEFTNTLNNKIKEIEAALKTKPSVVTAPVVVSDGKMEIPTTQTTDSKVIPKIAVLGRRITKAKGAPFSTKSTISAENAEKMLSQIKKALNLIDSGVKVVSRQNMEMVKQASMYLKELSLYSVYPIGLKVKETQDTFRVYIDNVYREFKGQYTKFIGLNPNNLDIEVLYKSAEYCYELFSGISQEEKNTNIEIILSGAKVTQRDNLKKLLLNYIDLSLKLQNLSIAVKKLGGEDVELKAIDLKLLQGFTEAKITIPVIEGLNPKSEKTFDFSGAILKELKELYKDIGTFADLTKRVAGEIQAMQEQEKKAPSKVVSTPAVSTGKGAPTPPTPAVSNPGTGAPTTPTVDTSGVSKPFVATTSSATTPAKPPKVDPNEELFNQFKAGLADLQAGRLVEAYDKLEIFTDKGNMQKVRNHMVDKNTSIELTKIDKFFTNIMSFIVYLESASYIKKCIDRIDDDIYLVELNQNRGFDYDPVKQFETYRAKGKLKLEIPAVLDEETKELLGLKGVTEIDLMDPKGGFQGKTLDQIVAQVDANLKEYQKITTPPASGTPGSGGSSASTGISSNPATSSATTGVDSSNPNTEEGEKVVDDPDQDPDQGPDDDDQHGSGEEEFTPNGEDLEEEEIPDEESDVTDKPKEESGVTDVTDKPEEESDVTDKPEEVKKIEKEKQEKQEKLKKEKEEEERLNKEKEKKKNIPKSEEEKKEEEKKKEAELKKLEEENKKKLEEEQKKEEKKKLQTLNIDNIPEKAIQKVSKEIYKEVAKLIESDIKNIANAFEKVKDLKEITDHPKLKGYIEATLAAIKTPDNIGGWQYKTLEKGIKASSCVGIGFSLLGVGLVAARGAAPAIFEPLSKAPGGKDVSDFIGNIAKLCKDNPIAAAVIGLAVFAAMGTAIIFSDRQMTKKDVENAEKCKTHMETGIKNQQANKSSSSII